MNVALPSKYRLLIVDDEELLRKSMVLDFQRKGFSVLSADRADAALKLLAAYPVDLILADLRMPGGGGMELLARLQTLVTPPPPVIFVTGFADLTEEECIARGARAVVNKPFDRRKLLELMCACLGVSPPSLARAP